ncbi:hypothetical protein BDR26DRAFT_1007971 [Obelidium mucronatum]|nr:hypothetical protein BDR26DRAFT_1007971 [Obelidium mucronatum]
MIGSYRIPAEIVLHVATFLDKFTTLQLSCCSRNLRGGLERRLFVGVDFETTEAVADFVASECAAWEAHVRRVTCGKSVDQSDAVFGRMLARFAAANHLALFLAVPHKALDAFLQTPGAQKVALTLQMGGAWLGGAGSPLMRLSSLSGTNYNCFGGLITAAPLNASRLSALTELQLGLEVLKDAAPILPPLLPTLRRFVVNATTVIPNLYGFEIADIIAFAPTYPTLDIELRCRVDVDMLLKIPDERTFTSLIKSIQKPEPHFRMTRMDAIGGSPNRHLARIHALATQFPNIGWKLSPYDHPDIGWTRYFPHFSRVFDTVVVSIPFYPAADDLQFLRAFHRIRTVEILNIQQNFDALTTIMDVVSDMPSVERIEWHIEYLKDNCPFHLLSLLSHKVWAVKISCDRGVVFGNKEFPIRSNKEFLDKFVCHLPAGVREFEFKFSCGNDVLLKELAAATREHFLKLGRAVHIKFKVS